jgi:hypothetical protein
MKPLRILVPALVIAGFSVLGFISVTDEWSDASGLGQRAATFTQAAYGVFGILVAVAALWRPRALGPLLWLWALALTTTAALAPVVWGGQSWGIGLIAGFAGAVLTGALAWWLVVAAAPSLWEDGARAKLLDRLRRLTPDARPRWGRMTAPQMLTHVNDQLRMSMGELPAAPARLPIRYPPLNQLVAHVLPWPKGLPTSPELLARIDRSTWPTEVATFGTLLHRFATRPVGAAWPEHPAFGRLSRRGWGMLGYRHTDHHFRQFGV